LKEENMKKYLVLLIIAAVALSGCSGMQTKTEKGAAYGATGGAVAGALVGQLVGRDTKATLIGAAVGAAVGGLAGAGVGKMMDNQERDLRQSLANSEAATIQREGNLLAVTLKGDVLFDFNSAAVKPGLYSEINKIADAMNQYPDTVARVEGHTDSVGSETYNMDLSIRRATAVRDVLVQRGVASTRLEIVGFGETMPVASNETEAGRLQNRRVEIKIAPATR